MKKYLKSLLLIPMVMLIFSTTITTSAIDFSQNEEYYEKLCFGTISKENYTVCQQYQEYINQKAKDAKADLTKLQSELKNLKGNIVAYAQKVSEYEATIADLDRQIRVLADSIYYLETNINTLEYQIVVREENAVAIDKGIRDRLVVMQGFLSVNGYIEFIMNATSFSDLIRRIEGIQDTTTYDKEQIKELQNEIERIKQDKDELERQKTVLIDNRINLESNQETMAQLKIEVEKIIVEYKKQESELMAIQAELISDLNAVQEKLKKVSEALNSVASSNGFIRPVATGYRISAGAWYYPASFGGGRHMGVDFAAPVGTALRAVGNGIIMYSANGCPTYGYLGSSCGRPGVSMGGNQTYVLTSINNKTYWIIHFHLAKDTVRPMGTIVNQGDKIGEIGSSGNSTGPHLHIEVVYVGNNSMNYYASRWNGDLSFGAGWGDTGWNRRCEVNGNKPPCRLNPLNVFNVATGKSY
jgi:murein DD-endopeptidase MepM/ murein hydrolase activator NlpD